MGLVEAVDFVLHVFAEGIALVLCEPIGVKIAPSLVFDEVFVIISIFSFSSP
jgi:hypothetical protein